MELVSKRELLREFEVEASFYNVKIDAEVFECRNQAKIKRRGVETNKYDAILILCNPGSCNPADKEIVPEKDPRQEDIPFIQATPDQTQLQIMRLMVLKEWKQVSIINLSDICSGNINAFKASFESARKSGFSYHSIFSNQRKEELMKLLGLNNGPIILGWGKKPFIKELAKGVLQNKLIQNIKGWKHPNYPYYYHPFLFTPEKNKEWLQKTLELLG